MINETELMSALSPDRRDLHCDLLTREKNITDLQAQTIVNKHRNALLSRDIIDDSEPDPDYDAANDAMLADLKDIPNIVFGCDDVFFQVEDYLTTYALRASDDASDDYHAPLDALLKYLEERKTRGGAAFKELVAA
jgi:hypothetical protein